MTEEPYRWVEAIANRREYIEAQLAAGGPIIALSFADGILLVTIGQTRQKLFEIYDGVAMGATGHPGDIERLRMAAIEVASTEGFTRSAADVSLRRLAHYSLSPVLKAGFEQIYGAPFLARLLFAEIGSTPADDLFLRVEYDGSISTNGAVTGKRRETFAVISGTAEATASMETFLRGEHDTAAGLTAALKTALRASAVAALPAEKRSPQSEIPSRAQLDGAWKTQAREVGIDAVMLERASGHALRYRAVTDAEMKAAMGD